MSAANVSSSPTTPCCRSRSRRVSAVKFADVQRADAELARWKRVVNSRDDHPGGSLGERVSSPRSKASSTCPYPRRLCWSSNRPAPTNAARLPPGLRAADVRGPPLWPLWACLAHGEIAQQFLQEQAGIRLLIEAPDEDALRPRLYLSGEQIIEEVSGDRGLPVPPRPIRARTPRKPASQASRSCRSSASRPALLRIAGKWQGRKDRWLPIFAKLPFSGDS